MKFLSPIPLAAVAAILFCAGSASAHISLIEPAARYNGTVGNQNKACPCGVGAGGGLCNVEGERSDDFRSPRVTTLEAGSSVVIQFDEYVGHSGRYRIAFDPDGADLEDFNANILTDIVDPVGGDGNAGGSIWEIEVTLPDTPCDNCTLQLIQVMDGDMSAPVLDPVGRSSYYQCADIVLVAPGSDLGGPGPSTDMGPGPAPDTGTPSADTGTLSQDAGAGGADAGGAADDNGKSGGCSTAGGLRPSLPLITLCVVFAYRRRRWRSTLHAGSL